MAKPEIGWSPGAHERIEAAWSSRPLPGLPTPAALIEAVMFSVRTRGLAALREPETLVRSGRCDAAAEQQIDARIAKLIATGRIAPEEASDAA
jgi:hypothetical protein